MRVRFAVIVGIASLTAAHAATAEGINYSVSPVIEDGALKALAVEMVFAGEPDGKTVIKLPSEWGGKQKLWRGISEFRVSGEGLAVVADSDPSRRIIRHAPNAVLTVRYRVTQFWPGEPAADGGNEYRPVIRPKYFHVIGQTVFAMPDWSLATAVTFKLKNLPPNWTFASDLEHQAAKRRFKLVELLESISVGGDFRVLKAGPLRVAIRGAWPFSDRSFIARLEPIIASHHKFWGDAPEPFLVTVLPLSAPAGHSSLGGTGLGDAFAFFATSNIDDKQLTRILAHEHLHTWIPGRIGRMPQDNDAVDYWLSEGFTDFYTYRLLVRDGIWSAGQVAKAFNDVMWAYGFSLVRNEPNARIARDFWNDPAVTDLPYQRGFLLATMWDDKLRRASKGKADLDDVMDAMRSDAAKAAGMPPLVRDLFVANMTKLGVDPSADIARFVEKGESVLLPEDVWAACGAVQTSEIAEFDRGFDGLRTIANKNLATGVDPLGPAYAAGLRENMRILKVDLREPYDSRIELVYQVMDGGQTREIRYLPAGRRHATVQEFKLNPALDEAGQKACAARLAGVAD